MQKQITKRLAVHLEDDDWRSLIALRAHYEKEQNEPLTYAKVIRHIIRNAANATGK